MSEDSEKRSEMANILDNLLKAFPLPELENLVHSMKDPLKCKDTADLMEVLQANVDMLKSKKESFKEHADIDTSAVKGYIANPNNFTKEQWEAIQKTKEHFRQYEREVDMALESGEIRQVVIEERKLLKKKRKKRSKRFKKRKNWIEM